MLPDLQASTAVLALSRPLKAAVKRVDCFIAQSQFIRIMHRQMGLQIPMEYIPSFVPLSEDSSTPSSLSPHEISKDPFFLFVGRLQKLKGLQTLIPIFRRYPKAQLWIARTGDDEPWLRQMAGGIPNIRFLGYLPGPKMQPLYRNATAVIVPSICFEASPLVIFEAFREQTPVILRNLGGLPEMVEQARSGFIYNTEEELVAAMDRLLSDLSYRQELGRTDHKTCEYSLTYLSSKFIISFLKCFNRNCLREFSNSEPSRRRKNVWSFHLGSSKISIQDNLS